MRKGLAAVMAASPLFWRLACAARPGSSDRGVVRREVVGPGQGLQMRPVDLVVGQLQGALAARAKPSSSPLSQARVSSRKGANTPLLCTSASITGWGRAMDSSAFSMGWPSITSSSENTPTTKALSHSSGESSSAVSSSIRRPRTTAVWPTAGGVPPAREVVSSSAAQRNSFFNPMSITAWRNEVISRVMPKPAELIRRMRLKARPASFFSTSSMASVLACCRTRLMSCTMLAWPGDSSLACTSAGRANQ